MKSKIKSYQIKFKTVKEESAFARHILKTISYRILGTATTVTIALLLGANLQVSSLLGIGELLIKPLIYFLHERFWYKFISIGRKHSDI